MDNISDQLIDRIANRIVQQLSQPMVELEASGRHVHLNQAALAILFGKGYALTKASDLSQPGQYACKERVTLVGPKKSIPGAIILGPLRPDTQVEVSATDATTLGLAPPVRQSGDIKGSIGIQLVGPAGTLTIDSGVIIAQRHIHITPEDAQRFGVQDKQEVDVQVAGDRATTFHNVLIRVSPQFATYMHIDYDEANACGFHKGMMGRISPAGQHSGR